MTMKGPLRHELHKYGKGRPGSIRGLQYARPFGGKHYASAPTSFTPSSFQQNRYSRPLPSDYHPNLNAPAVQTHGYATDQAWESHHVSQPHQPGLFRPYPNLPTIEEEAKYENMQTMHDFLLRVQELQYRHFEEGEEIPSIAEMWREHLATSDHGMPDEDFPNSAMVGEVAVEQTPEDLARQFQNISSALGQLQDVLPEDHPDIINLRMAFRDIWEDPHAMSKLESLAGESRPSKLGTGNPYAMDSLDEAEQIFDQQIEMVETQLEHPLPLMEFGSHDNGSRDDLFPGVNDSLEEHVLSIERMDYEDNLGPAGPTDAPGPESLEQVMDAYQTQATDGHSSDFSGIPSANSNSPAPEFYSADMFDAVQDGMATMPIGSTAMANEINSAMDQVSSPTGGEAMEPDPFDQSDPLMQAQQIFDEQMEFMEDSFMPEMLAPPGVVPGF